MDRLRQGAWLERVRDGWRWWLSELGQMLPLGLRRVFTSAPDTIIIDVQAAEFVVSRKTSAGENMVARIPRDEYAVRTLRLSAPHLAGIASWFTDPVILQLPAAEALERPLRLPRGASRNLSGILRHEVMRQSPIEAQSIYYDYRAVAQNGETLDVALRIIRREPVDALLQICRDADVAVSAVEFAGDENRADGGTFPVNTAAARELRLQPRIVPALAGLVLLLAVGLVGSLYVRGEAIAANLDDRVDQARAGAMAVEGLQQQLDAAGRQAAFLAEQKRNPTAVAVLATVSRLLPDDASLYEFEMNGDEVRLHGFSASAASLIALFDASPYFVDAQFRSPLMQGPNAGLQRFDISLTLKKGAS